MGDSYEPYNVHSTGTSSNSLRVDHKAGRNTEAGLVTVPADRSTVSQKVVSKPKIMIRTRSEVDMLDDGFKWRKYGQKSGQRGILIQGTLLDVYGRGTLARPSRFKTCRMKQRYFDAMVVIKATTKAKEEEEAIKKVAGEVAIKKVAKIEAKATKEQARKKANEEAKKKEDKEVSQAKANKQKDIKKASKGQNVAKTKDDVNVDETVDVNQIHNEEDVEENDNVE
ncbi:probable WRKY transcription factor 3 [Tanacetum coccineum]|uniref:Probable WRKY transcription factor 3 n=1 Tax=Tanacetum coccineum TaxID=301880 RepID=A0ABQ5JDS7_9ASTR